MKLHLDIETYCDLDLKKVGAYRYASDPSFDIVLVSFQYEGGPVVRIKLLEGEQWPQYLVDDLADPAVIKYAHNAPFEVVCLSRYLGFDLDWSQWRCTLLQAAYLGLPLGLDQVGKILNISEQKDARGKLVMKYWSSPCKPTKTNGGRTRNMPADNPEKWEVYGQYNEQDVRAEVEVAAFCERFPDLPPVEWLYWQMDQRINDRGVYIDREFVEAAIAVNLEYQAEVYAEMKSICGIDSPKKLQQLKDWIFERTGERLASLDKEFYKDFRPEEWPEDVARVLELRQLGSRAAVDKYDAMLRYIGGDDRVRGILQFYGANRTGREAGRAVQPQNMKKNFDNDGQLAKEAKRLDVPVAAVKARVGSLLETAREAVRKGLADVLYDDPTEMVAMLVRTAICAPEGRTLPVSDFSAIEARVVSWLAGEDWQLDVFRGDGKIYEATASRMFSIPMDEITKGSPYRAKGKVASLALGYQGGAGALITMGALREGLTEDELDPIKVAWRQANPNIVKLWKKVNEAAKYAIERRTSYTLVLKYTKLVFRYDRGFLFITLPSGRRLAYYGAKVEQGAKGPRIIYWGIDQVKKTWVKMDTYGGKLVENITQAVARDCLFDSMLRMDKAGIEIVMHVHDEIVAECDEDKGVETLELMENIMAVSPLWAKDLPLRGDGFVTKFYRKD